MANFAFIDIETTGLDATRHEIIEIAIVIWDGLKLRVYNQRICPKHIQTADPVALQINGYTTDGWTNAPTFADQARTIADLLCGCTIVGHNVHFDLGFIERQLKGCNIPIPRWRPVDTVTLVHEHLIPIGCPGASLDRVRDFLGWIRPHAHTALCDAMDVYYLYKLLVRASVWVRLLIWAGYVFRLYKQRFVNRYKQIKTDKNR